MCICKYCAIYFVFHTYNSEVCTIFIPIPQVMKQKLGDIKYFDQVHVDTK